MSSVLASSEPPLKAVFFNRIVEKRGTYSIVSMLYISSA